MADVSARQPRQRWMDLLRVCAVFLVVLEHAVLLTPGPLPTAVTAANDVFAPFRIPALMFLSGILLQHSLAKPRRVYLRGKFDRIAWPNLVWCTILILLFRSWLLDGPAVVLRYVLASGPMWYLQYLFYFYLVALVLPARWRTWLAVPALGVAATMPDGSGWERVCYLLAFFLAGDVAGRHRRRFDALVARPWVRAVGGAMLVAVAVASAWGLTIRYAPWAAPATLAALFAVVPVCQRVAATSFGRRISRYGPHTLVCYVVSWPAQLVVADRMDKMGVSAPEAVLTLLFVVGVVAAWVAVQAQLRWFPLRYLFDLRPTRSRPAS